MRIKPVAKLFKQYHRQLFILALSITKNRATAEDVVQDALIAVAEASTQPDNLKAYLFRCVRNKALHSDRQEKRFESFDESYLQSCNNTLENNLFKVNIIREIGLLNDEQQLVLNLKLFGGLTFSEIAELTETSINTVASQYRRGIKILQEKFNDK